MSMKERMKKLFSILLCLLMLVQSVPVTVFAAAEDGLCEHHTAHSTEVCGYREAVQEVPCDCESVDENGAVVHTDGCGYVAAVEGQPCQYACADCAAAAEAATEPTTEPTTEPAVQPEQTAWQQVTLTCAPDVGLPDNDELFAYFAEQKLYGYEMATFGTRARENLKLIEQNIYDALKVKIENVAANGGSTVFTLTSVEGLTTTWSMDALGVTEITEENVKTAVSKAFSAQFDTNAIVTALLNDCPFDLYWYDKTTTGGAKFGANYGISFTSDGASISNLQITFTFAVAGAYKNGDNSVTTEVSKVNKAKSAAQAVVTENASKSAYEKLLAYKSYICGAVTYNSEAASDDYTGGYGDPWQLIYVFDGDPDTNVVCEGYSKAFQYLCDLGGLDCICVSGTMAGGTGAGGHMWNVVTLGGKNYLVDVTNCDEGTVGAPDKLFMVGGTYADGYSYTIGSQTITYTGCGDLNLSATNYVAEPADPATCAHSFAEGKCALCGIVGGYCGGYGNEQNVWWTYMDGKLTISGTGNMDNYYAYDAPWYKDYYLDITSLSIGEGVTTIGKHAFTNLVGIQSVIIPASVTVVEEGAFGVSYSGTALESVTFAEGSKLTTIGKCAFSSNPNLKKITLPATVTSIGAEAFAKNRTMTDIFVAAGNTAYKDIDGVLYTADGKTLICYPAGRTATEYAVPDSVTTIETNAFFGNGSLQTLTLPKSLVTVGEDAFDNCGRLTTVHVPCSWDGKPLYTFGEGVTVDIAAHIGDGTCTACGHREVVTVEFNYNGGRFVADFEESDTASYSTYFGEKVTLGTGSIADFNTNAYREGYILTGWNTEPDGTGTDYGLTGTITMKAMTLYAQWETCTHEEHTTDGCVCGLKDDSIHSVTKYVDNGDGTHDKVCSVCDYVEVDNEAHTPAENATYTNNGNGTHSFECSVCGTTVTEEHTYGDEDGTCACGLVKTYTITLHEDTVGVKIVAVNGEDKEILPGGTFTAPHGKELKVKFENTVSQKETGVYCDAWDEDLLNIDYDYDKATNTMTIPANEVNRDFFIAPSAYVSVQFDLHGGTLTDAGRELLVESFGYTWDAETSTLKAGYSFNFALLPEYFQLAGHTFAGAKVNGSEEVVQRLEIRSDMTVDILWECDGGTLTPVEAKDATCMEAGNIAHYVCTCGKLYAEDQTTVLTEAEVKTDIDPTNHVGMDSTTGKCTCGVELAVASVTTDGSTTYYETLEAALAAADGKTATVRLHRDLTVAEGETFSFQKQVVLDTNSFSVTNHGTLALEGYTYSTIPAAITGGTVKIGEKSYTWDSANNKWICAEGSHVTELEENKATCAKAAICDLCGASYGEVDTTNHDETVAFGSKGFCENGCYQPAVLNGDVYEISNAGQLFWFAQQVNGGNTEINGKLITDIDLENKPWMPIGTEDNNYKGIFDGNGKTISGLYFNDSSASYVGLFGRVTNGQVKAVTLTDSSITGKTYVGGIAGRNSGTVTGCVNNAVVSGDSYNVGGIAGFNNGTVELCGNTGKITGSAETGGIAGRNTGTTRNCYNTGDVHANDKYGTAGGIAGFNYGTVEYCWSAGKVTAGGSKKGGIVGENYATIQYCYATQYVGSDRYDATSNNVGTCTAAQFASGEVAYRLGSAWGQTIGSQNYPTLGGKKVYYGYTSCGDTKADYTNNAAATQEKPDHTQKPAYTDNHNGTHSAVYPCCGTTVQPEGHNFENEAHQCICGILEPFTLHAEEQTLDVAYGSDLARALSDVTATKTGYNHTGWTYYYLDEEGTEQPYTGTTMPAKELYAQPVFTPIEYNITWDMAGCSYYVSNYDGLPMKLAYNVDGDAHNVNFTDITAPEGYEFVRFEDGDGNALSYVVTDQYRLNLTVSGDMTVKAVIQPKAYMATWTSVDGGGYEKEFKYGETITIPTSEIFAETFRKAGYTLTGWEGYTEGMTMPIGGVTFTAKWQINAASLAETSGKYTGKAHTPVVTVAGLTEGEDFTVAYPVDMTNVGEKTITVTGKLGGTTTVTYIITKADAPVIAFPTVLNEITYRQQVQEAKLSFYENEYGTFNWASPSGYPDGAGERNYALDFYPKDLENYDWAACTWTTHGATWIENRNALCTTAKVIVNRAESIIETEPVARTLTYTGQPQELVTAGSVVGGTLQYSVNGGEWSESVPTATEAGRYYISYQVVGNSNYIGIGVRALPAMEIDQAVLTITAKDHTITYGDTPSDNGIAYDGFVNGETEAVLGGTVTYACNYEQYDNTGTYKITPDGLTADNYKIIFKDGTLTVNKKPITVEANAVSKTYGDTDPTLTYTAQGLVNGDELTGELKRAAGENVGSYAIEQNTLTAGNNYSITYTGANLTINAKAITAADVKLNGSLTYNGKEQTQQVAVTEGINYTVTGNKATNVGAYELTVKGIGNYTGEVKLGWSIEEAVAAVGTAPTAKTLTYTGEEHALVNAGTAADGKLVYSLTENGEYTETIPTGKNAGSYTVWYHVVGDDNHSDSPKAYVNVTIAKAKPVITVDTATIHVTYGETVVLPTATANFGTVVCDKTAADMVNAGTYTVTYTVAGTANYDGDTKTIYVTVSPKAITAADVKLNGSLTYNGSEQTQQVTVTEGITYTVIGNKGTNAGAYELTVKGTGNYAGEVKLSWSIKEAAAVIGAAPAAKDMTYTGKDQALVSAGTTADGKLVYSLTENGGYTETIPTGKNAGSYTVWYYVAGDNNHTDSSKASVKVTIAKAELTVTAKDNRVTYGDAPANAGVTYTGFVNNETESVLTGTMAYSYNYAQFGNAGIYKITPSGVTSGNYEITFADGILTVNPKAITVTADAVSKTYGEADPVLTYKVEGLVNGDKLTGELKRAAGENAGSYDIQQNTLAADDNYIITYIGAKLTVNPKAITAADVKLNGSFTYNGSEQTQQVTVTEGITYEVSGNQATNAGNYELTVKGTGNYTGTVTLVWTVAKLNLTITADDKVIYIGEKIPALTYKVTGFVGSDQLVKEPVLTTNADADQVGSYTITAANADAGDNYTITYVGGSLTIMDKETEVETKIEQTELTQVPDGLKDTRFDTVEEITEELISKILTISTGFSRENMEHYDVALHFSLDGGESWILATEENFPTEGITVVLPYPQGTNPREYDFVVSHMFTVSSQRLGTTAGDVEIPQVEETANGIRVTLNGLSPVTVAAKYHDHTGGTATCTEKAVCTICGNAYGEVDKTNHAGGTEVKDAKEATCGAEGYTGDTYCKDCNEVVEKGTAIKATGEHTYGDWKVVKEPTKTAKGEKQRACDLCDHVDSEEIPVLSDTPVTGDDSNIILYGSIFSMSLAAIIVLLLAFRKRKQENA